MAAELRFAAIWFLWGGGKELAQADIEQKQAKAFAQQADFQGSRDPGGQRGAGQSGQNRREKRGRSTYPFFQ